MQSLAYRKKKSSSSVCMHFHFTMSVQLTSLNDNDMIRMPSFVEILPISIPAIDFKGQLPEELHRSPEMARYVYTKIE